MSSARVASGIEIEYETFGSRTDPALLLIMGFTTKKRAAAGYGRSFYPDGAMRQRAAIYATSRPTAKLIDGAHLLSLADMGHDLPEPLWPVLIGAIASHTGTVVR